MEHSMQAAKKDPRQISVGVKDEEDGISVEGCQLSDCSAKLETITASSTFGPRKPCTILCVSVMMLITLFSLSMVASQKNISPPAHPYVPHCRPVVGFTPIHTTNCPNTAAMINKFAAVDRPLEKTIIVAGCNNGIDAALLFSQYDASLKIRDWRAALRDLHPIDNGCGQLASSSELTQPPILPPKVRLHCIEAMPSNVELLRTTAAKVHVSSTFRIYPYAVGDLSNATIPFPNGRAGTGNIGIEQHPAGLRTVDVHYTSIDAMFGHLPSVDMLLIDTEGNDPLVLRGSVNTLPKVRYIEFENHNIGAWKTHSLRESIEFLDRLQFDCFWTGNDGTLTRITGCWERAFDIKGWSNVACAKRGDAWWGVMENMSNSGH